MIGLASLKRLYGSSPFVLQKAYSAVPWAIRMGSAYRRTLGFLQESMSWTYEDWKSYQSQHLRQLMNHCAHNVPHYRKSFRASGVDLSAPDIWSEFAKLPLINKSTVMADPPSFLSEATRKARTFSATTGGTTGKPLKMVYERSTYGTEWAFKVFFWGLAIGYTTSARKAVFRHFDAAGRYCQPNPIYNEMRFSPYHLVPETLPDLVEAMIDYAPEFIHGYPSALDVVARYCEANDVALPTMKGAILISENVLAGQAERIARAFNCKSYSFYGHAERVIFASMGPDLAHYLAHPAYGVTELVDAAGVPIAEPNVAGELVGTGFINSAMPLLRYRTGDYSTWAGSPPGMNTDGQMQMPTLGGIKGRWAQEHLVGRDGRRVSLTSLNLHDDLYDRLRHFQYVQEVPGQVQINIVPEASFSLDDADRLIGILGQRLGESFDLHLAYVDAPQRTPAGKILFLVQNIPSEKAGKNNKASKLP